ncbi:MAG: hypothetical protein ACI3Y0_01610 [Prevotella sp.]
MQIEDNKDCYEQLWRNLKHARRLLWMQNRRFCVRRIIQSWFPFGIQQPSGRTLSCGEVMEQVCDLSQLCGYDLLPPPSLYPLPHRELLRAVVCVALDKGQRSIDLEALDSAYSIVFPRSTKLNVSKKKHS